MNNQPHNRVRAGTICFFLDIMPFRNTWLSWMALTLKA